ncbi:Na(+)/Ca(2+) exchanging [Candidatus Marsarchaeota G1 archaeon OSP_C]|jgi:Ca2+/Na+ antiporter|uniref:Na(+)/Ca(2+) exchanging n=1 Tax=Candidatus Marsarchaeota G1 archaeon OSP_C TaxID=1978154 RepID=A0A2R6AM49_9ARCH|nr:MAG: Na(+)/Ca(2+) exchanging [Candidatus Marsarchaeota G1 archaeon OSP_C]
MLYTVLSLLGVLGALTVAAELIAKGTEELEGAIGQGMAGGVVLGFLTALPETIVVVVAVLNSAGDVALGSAIGGNVILFTLGIGLVGLVYVKKWKSPLKMVGDYSVEYNFLVLSTLALVPLLFYGRLDVFSGIPLCAIYLGYVAYRLKKFSKSEQRKPIKKSSLLYLVLGAALLLSLSKFLVEDIESVSRALGVPSVWLALVVSPLAAELEEKISAIRLASMSFKGGSIAIVSFIGSKIENASLLLGLIGVLSFDYLPLHTALSELIAALVSNLIALFILFDGKMAGKESVFLIALYFVIVYLTLVF